MVSAAKASVAIFCDALSKEVKRFLERTRVLPDVARIAVMPDVHVAGEACVGTVIATRRTLRPYLLGSDLGCGVSALPLGVRAGVLDDPKIAERVLHGIGAANPLLARPHAASEEPTLFEPLSHERLMRARDREGVREHGTVGRGNHFVELQEDDEGALWVMVHSGSRALGPMIQAHHVGSARPRDFGSARARDVVLEADGAEGRAYLADVAWAVRYAASSRRRMALAVAAVVGEHAGGSVDPSTLLDCHHDAIADEVHDGERYWVHRKGAVPAPKGAPVLVPGTMGTSSFHCEGRGEPTSMASSAHGAGRAMARGEAMRAISERQLADEIEGVIVERRRLGELRDEAPSAYKDIDAVLRAQRSLTKQVRRLRPRLVHK